MTAPDTASPLDLGQSVAVRAPSAWALERAMSIAQQALAAAADQGGETDADALLAITIDAGVDVHGLMLRLCLAADEDGTNAEACKKREADTAARRRRFSRHEEAKRAAIFGILQALPELFPAGKFKHALADASIRRGKDGIIVTDEAKLPDRFVKTERTPKKAEIAEAILKDGEIVPGAEKRNGAPYLHLKTS
jgi:hypothetical protein